MLTGEQIQLIHLLQHLFNNHARLTPVLAVSC